MPTTRPAARRPLAAAALLLALSGCSLGGGAPAPPPSSSSDASSGSGSASPGTSEAAERRACARVVETARTAPQRLGEDPLGLLEELTALADTAPAELAGQIREVRDAVDGFRQGERRLTEVVGELRELQQRCSA
ncbi:hypothetical protein [Kocuria rosea]|uniref:hypothetical protein n=1 Tax=Kocuria rosea TaxID=1275 RepID=UPI00203F9DB4|nr:hypothetical protein [Kocuria rosea]MCM3688052.1 hypothetical protein [Kocuria rosea]